MSLDDLWVSRAVRTKLRVEARTNVVWRGVDPLGVVLSYFLVPVRDEGVVPVHVLPVRLRCAIPGVVEGMQAVVHRGRPPGISC